MMRLNKILRVMFILVYNHLKIIISVFLLPQKELFCLCLEQTKH